MITTELIKIKNSKILSTEFIENYLDKNNIDFVRWAIVDIKSDYISLCVSYLK